MLKSCTNKVKKYRCERIKNTKCERAVEEGKTFFLRQCIRQQIKAEEYTNDRKKDGKYQVTENATYNV